MKWLMLMLLMVLLPSAGCGKYQNGDDEECGDGTCDQAGGENPCSCPEDCLEAGACCQDEDCPALPCGPCCRTFCEDYRCTSETLDNCCGNGECEAGEDAQSCPEDCDRCGDGTCDDQTGENPCSCPDDCLTVDNCCVDQDCPQPECGPCCVARCDQEYLCGVEWLPDCCWNNVCEEGEDADSCPQDCFCGNGSCDPLETQDTCPEDCACVEEGGWFVHGDDLQCCPGLSSLSVDFGVVAGMCAPLDCGVFIVCTACGDGECGIGETFCSCPQDCDQECVTLGGVMIGESGCCEGNPYVTALPLSDDPGCALYVCTECGTGTCDYGERADTCPQDCAIDCVDEGGIPGADEECCPGLAVLNSNYIPDGGQCQGAWCYEPVCASCGDGNCGIGENYCSCPDDCGDRTCVHAGGMAMDDGINDCCPGLSPVAVPGTGGCQQYTCIDCGDGVCGPGETPENCPVDCG
jgi:hypothetical protein